jgi:hypothetical protein
VGADQQDLMRLAQALAGGLEVGATDAIGVVGLSGHRVALGAPSLFDVVGGCAQRLRAEHVALADRAGEHAHMRLDARRAVHGGTSRYLRSSVARERRSRPEASLRSAGRWRRRRAGSWRRSCAQIGPRRRWFTSTARTRDARPPLPRRRGPALARAFADGMPE